MCGGTRAGQPGKAAAGGLSPRVRGNLRNRAQNQHMVGSIPACAGEPVTDMPGCHRRAVYPRVCGGTACFVNFAGRLTGLSPRVRGNRRRLRRRHSRARSIPACAGEPASSIWQSPHSKVYPRVCGGTSDFPTPLEALEGLSPRVRGNLWPAIGSSQDFGSIPACAGEPLGQLRFQTHIRVYPRVCGGTRTGGGGITAGRGLSPRVRGNRGIIRIGTIVLGSIPACAGEPRAGKPPVKGKTVYPRVCGGTPRCGHGH